MACQITSLTIVYLTLYSGAIQRKHKSSTSPAFVRGIHRWPMNSPHNGPVTRKMCPFDDVIIVISNYGVRCARGAPKWCACKISHVFKHCLADYLNKQKNTYFHSLSWKTWTCLSYIIKTIPGDVLPKYFILGTKMVIFVFLPSMCCFKSPTTRLFVQIFVQTKHQSTHYWLFVWGIHWLQVDFPHKGPVTRKDHNFNTSSWIHALRISHFKGRDINYRCRLIFFDVIKKCKYVFMFLEINSAR